MPNRPARAFTLVELLVVISIIAVLAGLSLAGLDKARVYSEKAACSSNLKQIGAGLLNYSAEHDGLLPISGSSIPHGQTNTVTQLPGWTEQLEPYMGGEAPALYRCAASARLYPTNKVYSYFQGSHPAYVANNNTFSAVKLVAVSQPAVTIMGGDIAGNFFDATDADKDDYTTAAAFPGGGVLIHGGSSNILFYDGHVAAFKAYDPQQMTARYEGIGDYAYP